MRDGRRLSDTPLGRAIAFALGGAALGLAEWLLVLVSCWHLLLSATEVTRFSLVSLWAPIGLTLVIGMLGDAAVVGLRRAGRGGLVPLRSAAVLTTAPLLVWAAWSLTAGRRLQDLPFRSWLVGAVGLSGALVLGWLAGVWTRVYVVERSTRAGHAGLRWALLLAAVALASLALDGLWLRRLYPALHALLFGVSLLSTLVATCLLSTRVPSPAWLTASPRLPTWLIAGLLVAAPVGVLSLRSAPNLRFVVELGAPVNGKLLAVLPHPGGAESAADVFGGHDRWGDGLDGEGGQGDAPRGPSRRAVDGRAAGADLRGRDVLLISVDALRADRLKPHGGHGLTPAIDGLAQEGVVFERAYTTTPHTSYAVSSLLTGKYMREVMALAGAAPEAPAAAGPSHVTLPDILRRYAYRTAAFYPPAIFFVDQHRFTRLSERQLGFEYAKRMFADGSERVPQLVEYLDGVAPGHPVFAWVHLFEPHEPYAPAEAFRRGDDPESRYDGEVAQADAAVGALVEAFRARRPNALVVVTADHGEEFGDHGGYHHGTTLYDEQVRVPLIWSAPDALPARRVTAAVDLVDVPTTVLSLLGIPRDVRMRGDDLSPLLVGSKAGEPLSAFAATDRGQMVMDGRFKLICEEDGPCRLFDVRTDPRELDDLSAVDPGTVARLRRQLAGFAASIAEVEALAMEGGGVPKALARARLGDTRAAAELVPLLGAERDSVRAAAAEALGELDQKVAMAVLTRLSEHDPSAAVRAKASIARVRLGDRSAHAAARRLTTEGPLAVARRAALALAHCGDASGIDLLVDWIADPLEDEAARRAAVEGLAALGDRRAVGPLSAVLQTDVRLRPQVATALGRLGGERAALTLLEALRTERYPESRVAEGWALTSIGDTRATGLIAEHLGRPSGMAGGLAMLIELGALDGDARKGYRLAETASVRVGHFLCEPGGCWPSVSAALLLPRLARFKRARLVIRAYSEHTGTHLRVAGEELALSPGAQQVSVTLRRTTEPVPLSADPGVLVEAVAVVPARAEIPPPPPEPWDAVQDSSAKRSVSAGP